MSLSWPVLFATLSLFGAPERAATVLPARAGQGVTLRVELPLGDVLLNREAPNRLTLSTPWGKATTRPGGVPHRQAEYAGYFSKVHPSALKVKVPAGTRSGTYNASLQAELFVCDTRDKLCSLRSVTVPVKVRVTAGAARTGASLVLKGEDLRPPSLKR